MFSGTPRCGGIDILRASTGKTLAESGTFEVTAGPTISSASGSLSPSTATTSSGALATKSPTVQSSTTAPRRPITGIVVGVVAGNVVILALAALLWWHRVRRRRQRAASARPVLLDDDAFSRDGSEAPPMLQLRTQLPSPYPMSPAGYPHPAASPTSHESSSYYPTTPLTSYQSTGTRLHTSQDSHKLSNDAQPTTSLDSQGTSYFPEPRRSLTLAMTRLQHEPQSHHRKVSYDLRPTSPKAETRRSSTLTTTRVQHEPPSHHRKLSHDPRPTSPKPTSPKDRRAPTSYFPETRRSATLTLSRVQHEPSHHRKLSYDTRPTSPKDRRTSRFGPRRSSTMPMPQETGTGAATTQHSVSHRRQLSFDVYQSLQDHPPHPPYKGRSSPTPAPLEAHPPAAAGPSDPQVELETALSETAYEKEKVEQDTKTATRRRPLRCMSEPLRSEAGSVDGHTDGLQQGARESALQVEP